MKTRYCIINNPKQQQKQQKLSASKKMCENLIGKYQKMNYKSNGKI